MTKESKARKATDEARERAQDTTKKAQETFGEAARAGQKMSEEAFRCWCRLLGGTGWQNQMGRLNEAAANFAPLARRNWDELFALWQTSAQAGTELFGKTFDSARQTWTDSTQDVLVDLWASAVKSAQSQVEAATQFGIRAMDSWTEFLGESEAKAQAA